MNDDKEHADFRSIARFDRPYYMINREERNLAAIFFHALLVGDNLKRFLDSIEWNHRVNDVEAGVYFEYAYLRDLWDRLDGNDVKRDVITRMLSTADVRTLSAASPREWNTHFGASPVPSSTHIQSPGKWSLSRFDSNIASNEDFLRTCRFKWSFNIKPDLVIHTDNDHAVCIEAKFASGEGSYPATDQEKAIFKRRGLDYVGQTELQREMFTKLLGVNAKFIYLVQDPSAVSATHESMLWRDAFEALDIAACPAFVRHWVKRLAEG